MHALRKALALALITRGICYARSGWERLGCWLLPTGPRRRCPACHGTGRCWDASRGGVGPCDCLD